MHNRSIKILSVGGSIIIPKTGFDIPFLKNFRKMIFNYVKNGSRLVLAVGGGATCRQYQQAMREVNSPTDEELDWLGIHSTIFNAQFVRFLLRSVADEKIITNPNRKIHSDKPVIIAAGWKPGFSTDMDAVLLAKNFGAKEVINLSNISYVYNQDPNKFARAKKITSINWSNFRREIVGNIWDPGKSAPFDPVASREAEKLGLKVYIVKGTNLAEVNKALLGRKCKGTVIV